MSYLAQRRMNIEEEGVIDVPASHFAKMCLVPTDMIWFTNFIESCCKCDYRYGHERDPPPEIIIGFVKRFP